MNKIFSAIGKIIFYVFVLVVALWTASLTLGEVKQILPGDALTPLFALALFDGGAAAWLFSWIGHARGIAQRAISLIMLVIDLFGVGLLTAARLFTGGQTLTEIPKEIGSYVIWGIVGATLVNLVAMYAFHITDPDVMDSIEMGLLNDTLRNESTKQAKSNIEAEAQRLGAIMASRATAQLKYNLRLPMSTDESQQVIEAQARDVLPQKKSIDWASLFGKFIPKPMARTYESETVAPTVKADDDWVVKAETATVAPEEVKDNGVFTGGVAGKQ